MLNFDFSDCFEPACDNRHAYLIEQDRLPVFFLITRSSRTQYNTLAQAQEELSMLQASLSEVGLIDHDLRIEEVYDHANN
jgi:hypothetical protein